MARAVQLRFEARDSGKGSFQLVGPRAHALGGRRAWEAKWTQSDDGSVTVSGTVEFPIGNVGRDAGTLVLKGKFGTEGAMAGEAVFFPLGQNPNDPKAKASKSGTFKAIRTGVDNASASERLRCPRTPRCAGTDP